MTRIPSGQPLARFFVLAYSKYGGDDVQRDAGLGKIYASGMLFNICYLMFAVLIPLDAVHEHLAVWMVGVLAAIPGVMQLPSRILSGPLVDWLGERFVLRMTFMLALGAALAVVVGQIAPMAGLVLGQLFMGAARGFFWTAAQTGASRDPDHRAQHLGMFTSFTKGGALIGIALSGLLAQLLGIMGGFALTGGLGFLALIIGWVLPKHVSAARPQKLWEAVRALAPAMHQPFIILNGLVALLCALPQALAQSFYPVVLIHRGLSDPTASLMTALMSFGMIVAGLLGAGAIRRWGMKHIVEGGAALLAIGLAGTAWHNLIGTAMAIFAAGFAAGVLNIAFLSAVSSRSRDGDRGTNLGVTQIYFVLAMMLTPLISGWLFAASGSAAAFLVDGGLAAAVGLVVMVLWNWSEPKSRTTVGETA